MHTNYEKKLLTEDLNNFTISKSDNITLDESNNSCVECCFYTLCPGDEDFRKIKQQLDARFGDCITYDYVYKVKPLPF